MSELTQCPHGVLKHQDCYHCTLQALCHEQETENDDLRERLAQAKRERDVAYTVIRRLNSQSEELERNMYLARDERDAALERMNDWKANYEEIVEAHDRYKAALEEIKSGMSEKGPRVIAEQALQKVESSNSPLMSKTSILEKEGEE